MNHARAASGIPFSNTLLVASLAQAGRIDEARAMLAHFRIMQPELSLAWAEKMVPYTAAHMPHFLEGLKKAGLT
jgi:hypothetical protein